MCSQSLFTQLLLVVWVLLLCTDTTHAQNVSTKKRDKLVRKLVAKMSVAEKAGQMTQLNVDMIMEGDLFNLTQPNAVDPEKLHKAIVETKAGSILNAGGHTWTREFWYSLHKAINDKVQETKLKVPVLYGVDAIHGCNYTAGATLFPQQIAQAATWNPNLVKRAAEITAYECRASGIPWNFSPVLDVARQPLWSRVFETFGEDPHLASVMTTAMIKGYEGDNIADKERVAACMKHFLGYSFPFTGKDRTPVYMGERQLREYFLPTFREAIAQGAHTVMINSGEINGIPVHANSKILVDLLRTELGFTGLAVTDWEDIKKLHNIHRVAATYKEAVKIAINAGIDLAMVPIDYDFTKHLIELVNEGEVPMARVDEAVTRILQLKYDLGLFDNYVYDFDYYTEFASESHQQAALQTALESITLLKNDSGILPLAKSSKILLTGPAANSLNILNGAWTHTWQGVDDKWNTPKKLTIMQAIAKEIGRDKMTYVEACTLDEAINIDKAVQAAQSVDYIVACIGELPSTEKPGDINDLTLPAAQIELVNALAATNKPIIVVIAENRPRIINAIVDKCDAILMTYLLGDEGGVAVSKTLFGDNNPSGKLPYTYPRYVNDLMTYDHKFAETLDTKFGHNAFNPQFEFGHGLSYTTFAYSDLQLSTTELAMGGEVTINVTVKNTGKRDGKEVVQVYVRDEYASITPSVKRLRAFDKVALKAGESKQLNFVLNTSDLAFIGLDNKPVTETGFFEVLVADQKIRFEVK